MERRFRQVDVFGETPGTGNPVAVVLDGDGLADAEMQAFANWTNLSETTFVLPPTDPGADYRVRIFTGDRELPFAGHPTLGTCHAWAEATGATGEAFVQECGAGLVSVRRDAGRLAFAAPPLLRGGPVDPADLERAAGLLGIAVSEVVDARWCDNGPGWLGILLADADAVLALNPTITGDDDLGVAGPHPEGGPCAIEVRAFFAGGEDPVTGSLNAALAGWLLETGRLQAPYVAAQGTALGRRGRVHVEAEDEIWIGGATATLISGSVTL